MRSLIIILLLIIVRAIELRAHARAFTIKIKSSHDLCGGAPTNFFIHTHTHRHMQNDTRRVCVLCVCVVCGCCTYPLPTQFIDGDDGGAH